MNRKQRRLEQRLALTSYSREGLLSRIHNSQAFILCNDNYKEDTIDCRPVLQYELFLSEYNLDCLFKRDLVAIRNKLANEVFRLSGVYNEGQY